MSQHFCGALVVILHHGRADNLGAADPTTDAHQNDQVLVAVRLHRRFHFVLRCFQFFLERVPLIVFGELVDTVAAAEHVLAYAQRLGHFDNVGADVFNLLAVFGFNRDESVGDQTAKIERDLGAVFVAGRDWSAHLADPIRFPWLFQRRKKFARSWNGD